jgi:transcriptional regulator with XRE-family HTH domain
MDKEIGNRIKQARIDKGLTQAHCAMCLGIPPQSWQKWESGERVPAAESIVQICRLLCVSADWLLGLK